MDSSCINTAEIKIAIDSIRLILSAWLYQVDRYVKAQIDEIRIIAT